MATNNAGFLITHHTTKGAKVDGSQRRIPAKDPVVASRNALRDHLWSIGETPANFIYKCESGDGEGGLTFTIFHDADHGGSLFARVAVTTEPIYEEDEAPTPDPEIRAIRESLNLNQTDFAELLNEQAPRLGATQGQVSDWELGKVQPHPALLVLIRNLAKP